ncbi:beta-phosphoglucomutase family hydrolase [soil metagenome]
MRFDWKRFGAVLFDLDGVLTPTASVHAAAWKQTFDHFLDEWAHIGNPRQAPFDMDAEYRSFVDGRPRFDGVATFLTSRGIDLPRGQPQEQPGLATICQIGNLKNELVNRILATDGVDAYPGSVELVVSLKDAGMALAVVSASANAEAVLEAAGIAKFFSVRVDGVVAAELGLRGKPAPDPFLEGARRLGVLPEATVVIEDAVSGVEAAVAGHFGAVIGVDRHDDPEALSAAGATVVVSDLSELAP